MEQKSKQEWIFCNGKHKYNFTIKDTPGEMCWLQQKKDRRKN